jgi:hypothetical protein
MLNLRKEALPFDFLSSCTPDAIMKAFQFPKAFFPPMGDVVNWAGAGFGHYVATDQDEHERLSRKFELRMERIKNLLKNIKPGGRVVLVHSCCHLRKKQTKEEESRNLVSGIHRERSLSTCNRRGNFIPS